MNYELWDLETGNIVEFSESQSELFGRCREWFAICPPASFAYHAMDADGKTVEALQGDALIQRLKAEGVLSADWTYDPEGIWKVGE